MYFTHFGLSRAPFRITPDPELFFPGGNRGAVLEALNYAIRSGEGIVKVVGEVGSGKTMLCRMLERELPDGCELVYLANPNLSPDDILRAIAFEMRLPVGAGAARLEVMHALQAHLLDQHASGQRVLMFIEEAQGMPTETLEELRLLSNLETSRDKLLQIVLFGQPELDDKLDQHNIRQLRERITFNFELPPLAASQIRDYLNARLRAVGFRGSELFSAGAIRVIARASGGLLRRVNILADKTLLAAYADNAPAADTRHARRAVRDSEFSTGRLHRPRWLAAGVIAGVFVLVSAATIGWWRSPTTGEDRQTAAASVPPQPADAPDGTTDREDVPIESSPATPAADATEDVSLTTALQEQRFPVTEPEITLDLVRTLWLRGEADD